MFRASACLTAALLAGPVLAQGTVTGRCPASIAVTDYCPQCQITAQVATPAGQACELRLDVRGAMAIETITVRERPRHGWYGRSGQARLAYSPAPGFRGRDRFSVEIGFELRGRRLTRRLVTDIVVE